MSDAGAPGLAPALLLGLLSGLPQAAASCGFSFNCPKGFRCCGDRCCQETEVFSGPLRIFVIIFIILVPLVCICALIKRFCRSCGDPEPDSVEEFTAPVGRTPSPPAVASVPLPDAPPPYSEIVLKPDVGLHPLEPPPPYSLMPPEPEAGPERGIDNPAF